MAQRSSARRDWCRGGFWGAAFVAALGCAGKDKNESGLRALDPRVKAALTAPDGVKPRPAAGDPAATGAKEMTVRNSFDRRTPYNPPASLTANANPIPGMPAQPTTGGALPLQPRLETVRASEPPVFPKGPEGGVLPTPDLKLAAGTTAVVPIRLDQLSPPSEPTGFQPINPAAAMPPIVPPPAPTAPPAAYDTGLVTLPSPVDKPITGLPIVPPPIK